MKKIYIVILDTTKEREDEKQMNFFIANPLNDISGQLQAIAKENNTPIDKMRLLIAPDKQTWKKMEDEYLKRVYFRGESGQSIFE